jgi:hypothetical protein
MALRVASLAALAVLAAGAARAQSLVDPDCIWAAAPADLRQEMRGAVSQHRDMLTTLTQKQISDLMRTCHVPNSQNNTARIVVILRSRTLIAQGEDGLRTNLGLTPEALAATWRRAPLNARKVLPHALDEEFETPPDIARSLDTLGQTLRITSDADREFFFDYAVGQSLLDTLGPR